MSSFLLVRVIPVLVSRLASVYEARCAGASGIEPKEVITTFPTEGRPTDTQVPGIQGHSLSTETALDRHNASLTQRVSPTVSKTNPNSHVPCTTVCNLIFQSVSHQDTSRSIEIHHDTFRYMYLYLVWHFGRLSRIRNRNDIQVGMLMLPRKMYLYVSYFKIHSGYIATP